MITGTGITKTFKQRGSVLGAREVPALRGVDFAVEPGGAVSFIGESGCGKTTLGRIIAGLETYDSGEIVIDGTSMSGLSHRRRQPYFRRIQLIHQDPYSALNPTRTIHQTLEAPLALRARQTGRPRPWVDGRAEELLSLVGIDPGYVLPRYPHQLSGGMRQRVVIARALTMDPEVLVADEAVSMIDVSLRLGILALLKDLRVRLGVGILFITHDIATARYLGDDSELYVIYRGQVVEHGPTETVITRPVHPYTQSLLSATPVLHGLERPGAERVVPIEAQKIEAQKIEAQQTEQAAGQVAGQVNVHDDAGCLFAPRCPFVTERCILERPVLTRDPVLTSDRDQDGETLQEHACFHPRIRSVIPVGAGTEMDMGVDIGANTAMDGGVNRGANSGVSR